MILSIIIPVHNGEKYLNDCLKSCFEQNVSKDDYQVICVDDGSTDNSQNILEQYKTYHNNLLTIYQEQRGVSKARNEGLKIAQGDYVWFVDADDFIAKDILRDIFLVICNSRCDRLKVSSYCFFDQLSDEEKKKRECGELISNYPYKNTQITRTIIRRNYIESNRIKFYEELFYGEDTIFNYETRLYNPVDRCLNKVTYFYRKHLRASTSFNTDDKKLRYFISCYRAIFIVNAYYKKGVSYTETRSMLIYWLDAFLDSGGQIDTTTIQEVISDKNGKTIKIQNLDCRLVKLNRIYQKVIINEQYDLLEKYHKKCEKRKVKRLNKQTRRKKLLGYLKHPKRLFVVR